MLSAAGLRPGLLSKPCSSSSSTTKQLPLCTTAIGLCQSNNYRSICLSRVPARSYCSSRRLVQSSAGASRGKRLLRRFREGHAEESSSPQPDTPGAPVPPGAAGASGLLVPVSFRLGRHVPWGQSLGLVGGCPQLGDWDTTQGLRLTWEEGDVWTGSAQLPVGRVIYFKYIILEGDSCISWGNDLSGGAGSNMQLRVTQDAAAAHGYRLELHPRPRLGAHPFLVAELDVAALMEQPPASPEDASPTATDTPAPATAPEPAPADAPLEPGCGVQLPPEAAAAVAAQEHLADDTIQLLCSGGSQEEQDSTAAAAVTAGGPAVYTGDVALDVSSAGEEGEEEATDAEQMETEVEAAVEGPVGEALQVYDSVSMDVSASQEATAAATMSDSNTTNSSSQQPPLAVDTHSKERTLAAGRGDLGGAEAEEGSAWTVVVGSGERTGMVGVHLDRSPSPVAAMQQAAAAPTADGAPHNSAGMTAHAPETTTSSSSSSSSGSEPPTGRAAATGTMSPSVTGSSDEEVPPELLALVDALWDSTPTPCGPEVGFQLTGEEGALAAHTANDELLAAAASRLDSSRGGDQGGSPGGPSGSVDLGPQAGLEGDISPMPADAEVQGVQLGAPNTGTTTSSSKDTASLSSSTDSSSSHRGPRIRVPEDDSFTAAASAAVAASTAPGSSPGADQPRQPTPSAAASNDLGVAGEAQEQLLESTEPPRDITKQASDAAEAEGLPMAAAPDQLTASTGAGSPSAEPAAAGGWGGRPPAASALAGDVLAALAAVTAALGRLHRATGGSFARGATNSDAVGRWLAEDVADVTEAVDKGAAAGIPAADVLSSSDGDDPELWGSHDEVPLPPDFYKQVPHGGAVVNSEKYPTLAAAVAAAADTVIAPVANNNSAEQAAATSGSRSSQTPPAGSAGEAAAAAGPVPPAAREPPSADGPARKLVAVQGADLDTVDLEAHLGDSIVTQAVTEVSPDTLELLDPVVTNDVAVPGLALGCVSDPELPGSDSGVPGAAAAAGGVVGGAAGGQVGPSGSTATTGGGGATARVVVGGDMEELLAGTQWQQQQQGGKEGLGEGEAAARVMEQELVVCSSEEVQLGEGRSRERPAGSAATGPAESSSSSSRSSARGGQQGRAEGPAGGELGKEGTVGGGGEVTSPGEGLLRQDAPARAEGGDVVVEDVSGAAAAEGAVRADSQGGAA